MAFNKDYIENVYSNVYYDSGVEANGTRELHTINNRREHGYMPRPHAMMETYGQHHGVWLPSIETMQDAYNKANRVREVVRDKEIEEAYYRGLDLDQIPSSVQLTTESMQAGDGSTLEHLYFSDILSAEYYRGAVRPDKHQVDFTIPGNSLAQQMHVHLLIRAFNNTRGCEDNAQMVKPFLERRHDPKLVEVLCWTVLKHCIMRSKSDEPLLTAYEPSKSRSSPGIETFAERFDEIAKSLTRSKTICKHLYDSPYIHVFVDDPARAVRRVNANRDLNRQKGQVMGKGKEVLEQELKASGGQTPESARRKRRVNAMEEAGESPGSEKRARRKSLIVTLPLGQKAASSPARAPSTPVAGGSGGHAGLFSTPASTIMESQSSPFSHSGLKVEEESPDQRGQTSSCFAVRSAWPWSHTQNMMSPTRGYGGVYSPSETYAHGNDAYSPLNSYGQSSISGGLGMNDLQISMMNYYRRPHSGYLLQEAFPNGPLSMFTRATPATSAPTTTRMPNIQDLCGGNGIPSNVSRRHPLVSLLSKFDSQFIDNWPDENHTNAFADARLLYS
ncbi:hypothetical protein DV737_g658, partial [Chaetothyriales sp. CBS 132003]